MRTKFFQLLTCLLGSFLVALTGNASAATTEQVIYNFSSTSSGYFPESELVYKGGSLFGTTPQGGAGGVVFSLTPVAGGGWDYAVLHTFTDTPDGDGPVGNLVADATGNLYGVTTIGGSYGYGSVYELSPATGGTWSYQLIFSFGVDSVYPSGLAINSAGKLYGISAGGGNNRNGTVYELTRASDGTWSQATIHFFAGTDGTNPNYGLAFDAAGNLYGSTLLGGASGLGTVFQLSPGLGGTWTESTLSNLTPDMGNAWNVTADRAGNVYGTSIVTTFNRGTVFELTRQAGGNWTSTTLQLFNGNAAISPWGRLSLDPNGNLYGTTQYGGTHGLGTVYKLARLGGGHWAFAVLYSLGASSTDGVVPYSGVTVTKTSIFGTTINGGTNASGTIFELTH